MKNNILFSLVTLAICAAACTSGNSQIFPQERQHAQYREGWTSEFDSTHVHPRFELFGNVDSVNIYRSTLSDKEARAYTAYKFNERGDVIKNLSYNSDGNVTESTTYEYDANGNLLREVIVKQGRTDADLRKAYDSHNRLVSETGFYYSFQVDITHVYDEYGKEIETINAGDEFKTVMKYDSENRLVEENVYGIKKGDHRMKTTMEYDAKGLLVKQSSYSAKNMKMFRCESTVYDESGRCVENIIELYDDNGVLKSRSIYRFNEDGDNVAKEYYEGPDNKLDRKYCFTYDVYGGLKEEKKYNGNEELEEHVTYEINYDSNGNRLKFEGRKATEEENVMIVCNPTEYEVFYK